MGWLGGGINDEFNFLSIQLCFTTTTHSQAGEYVKNLFIEPRCTTPRWKAFPRFMFTFYNVEGTLKNRSNGNSHMECRRFSVSH